MRTLRSDLFEKRDRISSAKIDLDLLYSQELISILLRHNDILFPVLMTRTKNSLDHWWKEERFEWIYHLIEILRRAGQLRHECHSSRRSFCIFLQTSGSGRQQF